MPLIQAQNIKEKDGNIMDLLIKNGTVVTASGSFEADVAVKDGKIAEIGKNLSVTAEKTVDASGKLVLPGALDVHTHLAMPFGGTVSADGQSSLAIGNQSAVNSNKKEGFGTTGQYSTAIGYKATVDIPGGDYDRANNGRGLAIGYIATVRGHQGIALGVSADANGYQSTVIGS